MIDGNNMAPVELSLEELDAMIGLLMKSGRSAKYSEQQHAVFGSILFKVAEARADLQLSIDEN